MKFEFEIEDGDFAKAGTASSQVKHILKQLNVDTKIIKKTTVAIYEAEVNVVAHAVGGGTLTADINLERIVVEVVDEGPGIEDIPQAMTEGFSTASAAVISMGFGAGMGLPNMRRNADKLEITSGVGEGTRVVITNYI
ncbi:ATP-binding protein [Desulfoluna spongiiphila]|uniref:Anti-sigma regulatory factor (Ser/Thr protein kinase) n=1 Tax=Desulfoluna spongiiphila TaxID=419481 RepID=A0A1G5C6K9_9BACT|nr:ATP-binding protein [Desulfoluna spongiiphila]SCX97986.1 Anti-sigma regulatory factor (Ser/Thr protein kinase) [Desulfoluna spongiiphila]VVS94145.1 histidine kinase/hsp90-like atpase [Desulfoluna spongiiphila]